MAQPNNQPLQTPTDPIDSNHITSSSAISGPVNSPSNVQPTNKSRSHKSFMINPITKLKKHRFLLILLLALSFLTLMLLLTFHKSPPAKNDLLQASQVATVTITDTGLNPSTIVIKSGSTLVWINSSTKARIVAADPYPKNDSIPNFDNSIVLEPSERLGFIFNTLGSYTYHDENDPFNAAFRGTIVVE